MDLVEGWEDSDEIAAAARIAHTFKLDPLIVLVGYDKVRHFEHDDFATAFAIRSVCHNVIAAELNAQAAAVKKGASHG
jgi:precorrin-6x reductase